MGTSPEGVSIFVKSKSHWVHILFCFAHQFFTSMIGIILILVVSLIIKAFFLFFEQDLILLRELLKNVDKTMEFQIFHSHIHLLLLVMNV